jgi:hypothetical protein
VKISTLDLAAMILAAPVLLSAGCTAVQLYQARDAERMLAEAGFHMRPADTPERQEELRSMPPYQIVLRTEAGNAVYTYADPDTCRCLYVGGYEEYSRYERIRVRRENAQRSAGSAGGAP